MLTAFSTFYKMFIDSAMKLVWKTYRLERRINEGYLLVNYNCLLRAFFIVAWKLVSCLLKIN